MTELADGDTALSTTALVVIGIASVAFVPAVAALLVGGIEVPMTPIIEQLVVAVVAPMLIAVGARAWQPDRIGRYDAYYPTVSAVMVILITGAVTAANAAVIRSNSPLLAGIGLGVVALNSAGYMVGFLVGYSSPRPTRIASMLSVGMRVSPWRRH